MTKSPEIDWRLAASIGRLTPGPLPDLDARELRQLVADLRVTARRAGELAGQYLGIDSGGANAIAVVDWAGWGKAVADMADAATGLLDLTRRRPSAWRTAAGIGGGVAAGALLRLAGPRLLGQYDAYTGADTLYLLAPTIVNLERAHGFTPADFRLWVSLHEQTHALQFRAAPWLRDHLIALTRGLVADDLDQLVAIMTFLEGHADHTADTAGRSAIGSVRTLRRAFTRKPGALSRLAGRFDKGAQYREGLEFCRQVARRGGRRALSAAFAEPAALPAPAEITDPAAWLKRVRG